MKYRVIGLTRGDQRILDSVEAYSDKQAEFLFKRKHGFGTRIIKVERMQVVKEEQLSLFDSLPCVENKVEAIDPRDKKFWPYNMEG